MSLKLHIDAPAYPQGLTRYQEAFVYANQAFAKREFTLKAGDDYVWERGDSEFLVALIDGLNAPEGGLEELVVRRRYVIIRYVQIVSNVDIGQIVQKAARAADPDVRVPLTVYGERRPAHAPSCTFSPADTDQE